MASIPKRQSTFDEDPELERLAALARSHEESTYRESLLESIFVAELVQSCAMTGRPWVEIARGFVDFQGYDLVATCGRITRHIQLKSSKPGVDLHRALADKPSGCCIITAPYVDPLQEVCADEAHHLAWRFHSNGSIEMSGPV